jgi:hypothetical protein
MPTSKSSEYCVISAPFGRLGVQTELVDGSLMISKIDYLPLNSPLSPSGNSLAKARRLQSNAISISKRPNLFLTYHLSLPVRPTREKFGMLLKALGWERRVPMVRSQKPLKVDPVQSGLLAVPIHIL